MIDFSRFSRPAKQTEGHEATFRGPVITLVMPTPEQPPDIPDHYLTEIGRVTTRWAMLESVIDLCLMKLAGKELSDPRSLIIFNHMAFPMKLDAMGALVSELVAGHPSLSGFSAVLQLLKQSQEKRNYIAHSQWGIDDNNGEISIARLSARGKLKHSIAPISVQEITEAADLLKLV